MTQPDWTPPHSHEPNPAPPSADAAFTIVTPRGRVVLSPGALRAMPQRTVPDCTITSTGHGPSGPFAFGGVPLIDLVERHAGGAWVGVVVMSADGFGARLSADELRRRQDRPPLLALSVDGRPLRREEGLVRLIVPDDRDDALRQVKWIGEITVIAD